MSKASRKHTQAKALARKGSQYKSQRPRPLGYNDGSKRGVQKVSFDEWVVKYSRDYQVKYGIR